MNSFIIKKAVCRQITEDLGKNLPFNCNNGFVALLYITGFIDYSFQPTAMSKPKTPLEPGKIFHIYTHANGNENLFASDENYLYFLKKYGEHIHPIAETFAYCLMPNHIHLMARIRSKDDLLNLLDQRKPGFAAELRARQNNASFKNFLSQQFSNLFNAYTKAYNLKYNRRGSLFASNFERKLVSNESYYSRLIAYIHLNPIHHGFVTDLNHWPHSSWHSYITSKPTKVAREEGMRWYGDKEEFVRIHWLFKKKDIWLEFDF